VVSATTFIDLFPVMKNEPDGSPYVYFDSRTYRFDATGAGALNGFATLLNGTDLDAVRPILGESVNANFPVPSTTGGTYATLPGSTSGQTKALSAWQFMNPETFQILSPGPDGRFGLVVDMDGGTTLAATANADPVYWRFPSGTMIRAMPTADDPQDLIVPSVDGYALDTVFPPRSPEALEAYERDNIASFARSTFEEDLP
jgi:hypothetical protein